MANDFSLLTAKVVVLEALVRALFRDTFLDTADPVATFDAWAQRFSGRLEAGIRKDGTPEAEIAWTMVSAHLDGFLDQLRHELQGAQDRRSP